MLVFFFFFFATCRLSFCRVPLCQNSVADTPFVALCLHPLLASMPHRHTLKSSRFPKTFCAKKKKDGLAVAFADCFTTGFTLPSHGGTRQNRVVTQKTPADRCDRDGRRRKRWRLFFSPLRLVLFFLSDSVACRVRRFGRGTCEKKSESAKKKSKRKKTGFGAAFAQNSKTDP